LIGAARSVPEGIEGPVVVLDFGSTEAKRGIAFYENHALHRLRVLPSRSVTAHRRPEEVGEFAATMAAIIAETIKEAGASAPLAPNIPCSVAAYVRNKEPMRIDRGAYTCLHRLSPDIRGWFSEQIGGIAGRAVQIEFAHDCDVAACALAGRPNTAVLMLGTALCAGFVPPGDRYRPIADHFTLDRLG
jgi:hypothetical protein